MLGTLKKSLSRARRDVRKRVFGNSQSEAVNLRYWRYRRHCQEHYRPNGAPSADSVAHAQSLMEQGYEVLDPPGAISPDALQALKTKVDSLFDHQDGGYRVQEGLYRLMDGLELTREIVDFIDPAMEETLTGYFSSQFKIFSVSFYRTVPTGVSPDSSFLWHLDNVPTGEIKLMIYLDEVTANTGALSVKARATTNDIFAKGYRDRWSLGNARSAVEDQATTQVIEGGIGTRILFENGSCLHKATFPEREHRDVVTFVLIPSDVHWRVNYARNRHLLSTNAGICVDPFRDRPESMGYQF